MEKERKKNKKKESMKKLKNKKIINKKKLKIIFCSLIVGGSICICEVVEAVNQRRSTERGFGVGQERLV